MEGRSKNRRHDISFSRAIVAEPLEYRMMLAGHGAAITGILTGSNALLAQPTAEVMPGGLSSTPYGLSPATMRQAYGMNVTSFGGVAGDGTGMTIAIVDYGNAPNITSDLAAFDTYYSLPAPPSFSVLNETGGASPLPATAPTSWGIEISLDVEWVHAMAPSASIDLVEANSSGLSDLMPAVNIAKSLPGVCAVSMSWSVGEFYGDYIYDSDFTTPSGHTGVTFVADTGDYGAYYPGFQFLDPQYPASSPNVLSVGATTLSTNNGAYVSESGWGNGTNSYSAGGSGGGISSDTSQPSWQNGIVTQSTTQRCTPDVSMDGDPSTGASVYDSYDDNPSTPWMEVGGTSLATPMWAAVIAIADQGRVHNGLQTLDGATQTLPMLYSLPSSDFHDITSGNNYYAAGTGYDLVTGLGTPVVNLLAPALAGNSAVTTTTTAVTSSNSSSNYGQSVTFTATVTPSIGSGETGTVQFQIDGSNIGSAMNLSGNTATYTTATLGAGSHSITAIYGGDSSFAGSTSSTFSQSVSRATLSITASADSKIYGQTKTYGAGSTAFVSSGLENSETIGSVTLTASGGTAFNATVGSYLLIPSAATGGTFNTSDYTITYHSGMLNVNQAILIVTATGINKFYDGGTLATVTLSDNRVNGDSLTDTYTSAMFSNPNAGTGKTVSVTGISISGTDAGDYTLQSTTASTTANIIQSATTTAVNSSAGSATFGQAVTFNATVTSSSGSGETGTIQFKIDGINAGSAMNISGGSATYTTSTLAGGTHSIVAVYSGDGNFNTSTSSAFTQTIASSLHLIGTNYLELDGTTARQLDVWAGTSNSGTPTAVYQMSQIISITDDGSGGNNTLTVDFTNGNPLATATPGLSFVGTSGADAVTVVGDNDGDTYNISAGKIAISGGGSEFSAVPITSDNVISETIKAGIGPDVLKVNGSTNVTYMAPTSRANPTAKLYSLSIGSGSKVVFASPNATRALLQLSSATNWAGQLDLQSNDMLIQGGSSALSIISSLVASGFNRGRWTGQGITSSSAASDTTHLTALGAIQNNQGGSAIFNSNNLFDGVAPAATDVLVKYTYYGDANLDGMVDGSDYSLIDNGFLSWGSLNGWYNGDFNYDGATDGSDYTLIDNAHNMQGQPLALLAASPDTTNSAMIASEASEASASANLSESKARDRSAAAVATIFQSAAPIHLDESPNQSIELSLQSKDMLDRLSIDAGSVNSDFNLGMYCCFA